MRAAADTTSAPQPVMEPIGRARDRRSPVDMLIAAAAVVAVQRSAKALWAGRNDDCAQEARHDRAV